MPEEGQKTTEGNIKGGNMAASERPGGEETRPQEPTFEEKIRSLIETEEGKEPQITDDRLRRLARLALDPRQQTRSRLEQLMQQGDGLYFDPQNPVPEEQWGMLAGAINEWFEKLGPGVRESDLGKVVGMIAETQQGLVESFKRFPPEQERARWVDQEYNQDFYQRFTPSMEPRFYTELSGPERELLDARWQLARAAYFKKAYSGFPEKQFENQDLHLLTTEQMERLYQMPGVRKALEWYADVIVNGREIQGKSIWQCKSGTDFEGFRKAMREAALGGVSLTDLQKKEADAVAWNWTWCTNLVESMDSRYAKSGSRHGDLPGVLVSDDSRAMFHPQEKYEDKCRSGLEWGAFGKWGATQMTRIRERVSFDRDRDRFEFVGAPSPGEFWKHEITKKTDKDGRIVRVYAPECYPTTIYRSFWEEMDIERRRLLDFLLNKEEISWGRVGADPWIGYLPVIWRKAVEFFDFYNPGKPPKDGWVVWARSYLDCFRRLGFEREETRTGEEYYHNLRVWAVYASLGGVMKPQERQPTPPLSKREWSSLSQTLRMKQIGFLERGIGAFTGEQLSPR